MPQDEPFKLGLYLQEHINPTVGATGSGFIQGALASIPETFGLFTKGLNVASAYPVAAVQEGIANIRGTDNQKFSDRVHNVYMEGVENSLLDKYFLDSQGNVDIGDKIRKAVTPVTGDPNVFAAKGGASAELASAIAQFTGALATGAFLPGVGLAKAGGQVAKSGSTIMNAVKEGAKVGAATSLPTGLGAAYDSSTQTFSPGEFSKQVGIGTAFGAAAPAAFGVGGMVGSAIKQRMQSATKQASQSIKAAEAGQIQRQVAQQQAKNQGISRDFAVQKKLAEQAQQQQQQQLSSSPKNEGAQVSPPPQPMVATPVQAQQPPPAFRGDRMPSMIKRIIQGQPEPGLKLEPDFDVKSIHQELGELFEQQLKQTPTVKKLEARKAQLENIKQKVTPGSRAEQLVNQLANKVDDGLEQSVKSQRTRRIKKYMDDIMEKRATSPTTSVDDATTLALDGVQDFINRSSSKFKDVSEFNLNMQKTFNPTRDLIDTLSPRAGKEFSEWASDTMLLPKEVTDLMMQGKSRKQVEKLFKTADDKLIYGENEADLPEDLGKFIKGYQAIADQMYSKLKTMGYNVGDRREGLIVWRNIKDLDGLLKQLNKSDPNFSKRYKIAQDNLQDQASSPAFDETLIIKNLLRERKIDLTEDLLKFYYSPFESLAIRGNQIGRQLATGKFFGGGLNQKLSSLASKKAASYGLSEGDRLSLESIISQVFSRTGNANKDGFISALNSINRSFTLGKATTAFRQVAESPIRYMDRFNVMNTLKGFARFANKPIKMDDLSLDFINDIDNTPGGAIKQFEKFWLWAFNGANKMEGQMGLNSSYEWVINESSKAIKKGKMSGNFRSFIEKNYEPSQQARIINKLSKVKSNPDALLDIDILDATMKAATEQGGLVLSKADKALNSLDNNKWYSTIYNLASYQLRNAKTVRDRTIGEISKGNFGTALKNLTSYTAISATGFSLVENMISRWSKHDLITPEEELDEFKEQWLQFIPMYNRYIEDNLFNPDEWDKIIANKVFPGVPNTIGVISENFKLYGEDVKLRLQGKKDLLSPELAALDPKYNKKFKYGAGMVVPGFISELAFKGTDASKSSAADAFARNQPFADQAKEDKQYVQMQKKGLDPELAGTVTGGIDLRKRNEDLRNMKKYGTTDKVLIAKLKARRKELDALKLKLLRRKAELGL